MLSFTGQDSVRSVEPGAFDLMVGSSSSDIRLTSKVVVSGEVRQLPKDWRMESRLEITRL